MTTSFKNVIADLFPRHPIYIPLLPVDAQEVIANVHAHTKPARKMLSDEGFQHRNLIDIFDGGPVLHCQTSEIRTVRESRKMPISEVVEEISQPDRLVGNCQLEGFRVCLGKLTVGEDHTVAIDRVTALELSVRVGDLVRFVDLRSGTH